MAEEGFKRKLTAILSADVEGYSRLMGDDEEATVRTLKSYREVLTTLIQQHNGIVLDSPGDNLLAEFISVVDAVQCAVAVQKEIHARNEELAENRRMQFRIGINLGDVIQEEGRIYGDGVNIAARLEGLAEPGGICISKTAFDHIESKLPYGYEFLGDQTVKNISKPVGAYRVMLEPRVTVAGELDKKKKAPVRRMPIYVGITAVLLFAIAVGIWQFYARRPTEEPASLDKMAFPLPEKPSIAVLPFENIGGDPEQEHFGDGLAYNIITQLAQLPQLFVISRESTLAYKDKNVQVKQIAEELSVRYILEGSIQGSEDRVRVTAQLIDAITGRHVWADRYERELKDIFAIQDEITHEVVIELVGKLAEGEQSVLAMKNSPNLEAYKYWLKALAELRKFTGEGFLQSRKFAEKAIEIDPQYGLAYTMIAWNLALEVDFGISKNPAQTFKEIDHFINKALEVEPDLPDVYSLRTYVYKVKGQYDKAIIQGRLAVEKLPSIPDSHAFLAEALNKVGQPAEAIEEITTAMRLAPSYPTWFLDCLAQSYFLLGRYEEAIVAYKKHLERAPHRIDLYPMLVVINTAMGNEKQARIEADVLLKNWPRFSLKEWGTMPRFEDEAVNERILNYARKAGLPEHSSHILPEKPSIAVLPFDNLSGDPEQDHLSDGISDQIIAGLAKIPDMIVIAKESSFSYKNQDVKVQQISKELGVQYILEGSVLKSGNRLRITAQLIDGATGHHLWSERYNRILDDLFAVLDDITMSIMQALQLKVAGLSLVLNQHKAKFEAYEKVLIAMARHVYRFNKDDNLLGRKMIEEAIEIDPKYIDAYRMLGWTYVWEANFGWTDSPAKSLDKAEGWAQKALSLGDEKSSYLFADICHKRGQLDKAVEIYENGYAKNSNWANYNFSYAWVLCEVDREEEALAMLRKAMRLNPQAKRYNLTLSLILNSAGYYEEALDAAKINFEVRPNIKWSHVALIWSYINLDREEDAREAANKLLKLDPKFSSQRWTNQTKNQEHKKQLFDALRKAGLPE
jgi:TolB-like protein/class 3 adenylate cyclase/predicted Zn-dependent protease